MAHVFVVHWQYCTSTAWLINVVLGACKNPQSQPIFVNKRNVRCAAMTVDVEGQNRTCSSSHSPPHLSLRVPDVYKRK